MGKSTISMVIFNSKVLNYQRVNGDARWYNVTEYTSIWEIQAIISWPCLQIVDSALTVFFLGGEELINRWILGTRIFRQTQWNLWITGNSCCPTLVHFFLSGSLNSLWALFWELFWSCPWGPSKHHGNRRYKSRNWSCAIHQVAKKDVQCISASTSCNYLFSSQKQHFFCCRGPSRISHVLVCSIPTFQVFFWFSQKFFRVDNPICQNTHVGMD